MIYIVTLNWNTSDQLIETLRSVRETVADPEECTVIVVDNGSTPAEREKLSEHRSLYDMVLDFPVNVGIPAAHNHALDVIDATACLPVCLSACLVGRQADEAGPPGRPTRQACQAGRQGGGEATYDVVLLDSDVTIQDEDWVEKARDILEAHPECGLLGLSHDGPVFHYPALPPACLTTRQAEASAQAGRQAGRPAGQGLYWYKWPELKHAPLAEGETVDFAFVWIPGHIVAGKEGLRFDHHRYKFYDGSDQDFCWQVRQSGWSVYSTYTPSTHRGSVAMRTNNWTLSRDIRGKEAVQALRVRNQQAFIERWREYLAPKRSSVEDEWLHLERMRAKFRISQARQ